MSGDMAEDAVKWRPPLKAPAVEVFSLLSDDESIENALIAKEHKTDRDASGETSDEEDDQWSLYEDALGAEEDGDNICYGTVSWISNVGIGSHTRR